MRTKPAAVAKMTNKIMSLKDAVAAHVKDGDTIFVGGFGQCVTLCRRA